MLISFLKDLARVMGTRGRGRREPGSADDGPALPLPVAFAADEEACRRAVEAMPNFAEAHINLGVHLKNTMRPAEAEAAFRRAILLQKDNALAHYNLGVVLAETGRTVESEAAYRRVLELAPEFVDAHNNLGALLLRTARPMEAEAAFRRALELRPDFVDAARNLDVVIAQTRSLAAAEAQCRAAVAAAPDSAVAHVDLGVALWNSRRHAEAEASFRHAVALQPENVAARFNLGVVLAGTDRPWEAEAAYRATLSHAPDLGSALFNLGGILKDTKRLGEAEVVLRKAVAVMPGSADAHNNLGAVLKDALRPAEAEIVLRRALALDPRHEAARLNLDYVRHDLERHARCEQAGRLALERGLPTERIWCRLAAAQMAQGRVDEAIASFEQALVVAPGDAGACHGLGLAMLRTQRIDSAIHYFRAAISAKPGFCKAMASLATAYRAQGNTAEALRWNREALALEPGQELANANLASLLLEAGQADAARECLSRACSGQFMAIEYATDPRRTVLVLLTTKYGNVPTVELLFPTTVNTRVNWTIESERDDLSEDLPEYDVVFNAMGDPDLVGASEGPLERFAASCAKPLLNRPERVARTARDKLPTLLAGIDNLLVPEVWRYATPEDWDPGIGDSLPLLVRPVESHGGAGLLLARTPAELARFREAQAGPVYVTRFVDFRSADSCYRKYRMIYVDREPWPYHLAIAPDWMVHYYTAEMEPHPWKLAEETAFLRDPEAALGTSNMRAVRAIGAAMDLDYAGIDFSVMPDGRLLVFEANPTMLAHPENVAGLLAHKNEYVFHIQRRFEEMLQRLHC